MVLVQPVLPLFLLSHFWRLLTKVTRKFLTVDDFFFTEHCGTCPDTITVAIHVQGGGGRDEYKDGGFYHGDVSHTIIWDKKT